MKTTSDFILFSLVTLILFSCEFSQKEKSFMDRSNSFAYSGDTLLIIFNNEDTFSFKRKELLQNKTYIHYRKYFKESPDLIINIGHYPDQTLIKLLPEDLSRYPILYDSNTTFNTWANQSYDTYFFIEKHELFHSLSDSLQFLEVSFSAKGEI
ncbi:hypothetical protein [Algoriphagus sp.]|uniref:hypothetical protein n=1 Tax=Algoriphagus sp. TaxID=1872435 RepID=UPI00391DAD35